ncbi:MAG: hypothetical protein ACTXOO_01815 [Sodalis sp. (in: enterobacteria)]
MRRPIARFRHCPDFSTTTCFSHHPRFCSRGFMVSIKSCRDLLWENGQVNLVTDGAQDI